MEKREDFFDHRGWPFSSLRSEDFFSVTIRWSNFSLKIGKVTLRDQLTGRTGKWGAPDWGDVFPIEHGDIPASYISLPEGKWLKWLTQNLISSKFWLKRKKILVGFPIIFSCFFRVAEIWNVLKWTPRISWRCAEIQRWASWEEFGSCSHHGAYKNYIVAYGNWLIHWCLGLVLSFFCRAGSSKFP